MEAVAGERIAGYRILRLIGRGASSSVYLAESPNAAEPVALKLVDLPDAGDGEDAAGSAFLRAVATAGTLRHPDIVAVHACGRLPRLGWLAMEPVPGGDLARHTQAARLLPERLVVRLGMRLALALAHAHARGVVHRDLKPANVLVHWPSDAVKLCDFGLARDLGAEQTRTGMLLGSPAYMAPELLAGAEPGAGSDCYALGVMLFELLLGRRPHDSASMGTLLHEIATRDAPDLGRLRPDLPTALTSGVMALLSRQPASRQCSAAAAGATLQAVDATWPADRPHGEPRDPGHGGRPDLAPVTASVPAPVAAPLTAPARAPVRAIPR